MGCPAPRLGVGGGAAVPRTRRRCGASAARPLLAALLALALVAAAAPPARAQDDNPASVFDLVPSQVDALSAVSGCGGASLGPNLNDCVLEDNIRIGDNHEYTFVVPDRTSGDEPFSVLLTAKSIGGFVEM
jgi:hypothetical protein